MGSILIENDAFALVFFALYIVIDFSWSGPMRFERYDDPTIDVRLECYIMMFCHAIL